MRIGRRLSVITVGLMLAGIACDNPNAPEYGAIRVVVTTAGQDIRTQGLGVTIGNMPFVPLDSGRLDLVVPGLSAGAHSVRLDGLATSCEVASANPRVVTVVKDDTTVVTFTMVCARRVGSVRVTTTTTGVDLDPDGYVATLLGGPSQAIAINGTATFSNISEGTRAVTLSGVATNCDITGLDTATVTISYGQTVDHVFAVGCVRFGSLEIRVATSGVDVDLDGYTVDISAPSVGFTDTYRIEPNGSLTLPRVRPAADYQVGLQGVSANCGIIGADKQTVGVSAGGTARVEFAVSCQAALRLALVRDGDIYLGRTNGPALTPLAQNPAYEWQPDWSSTGRLVFVTIHEDNAELHVIDENGASPVRITTSPGADTDPSWSPDGGKIVFQSDRDGNSEIYVVNADGTGLTRLTNNGADDGQPAWSSTGKIAFVSNRDQPSGEVYVMNEDGSNVVRITNNGQPEQSPAWSPDGAMIAFGRVTGCDYYCFSDIYVARADGSNEQRLVTSPGGDVFNGDPAWAPSGRTIAFTQQYCPYYCDAPVTMAVNIDGTHLTPIAANTMQPAWKP